MDGFESVSIIMATSNETDLLKETFSTIYATCRHEDIREIIVVIGDKSTSANLETVEALRASAGDIPVVVYKQKQPGVGMAFREGFKLARGSHIIGMVSDCEMDVNAVHVMIEQAKLHPDTIITTSRRIEGGDFVGYNWLKELCSFWFQKLLRLVFNTDLTDITNSYQICPAPFLKSIKFNESRKPFFLELMLKPIILKAKFIEIPCVWHRRTDGLDKNSFISCFEYFRTVVSVRLEKPEDMIESEK